jgi:O-methyltransferase involved in polyketide biosynthesis
MTTGKIDLTGVQATTLVTLFLRALDARSGQSVLGDRFAAEAVDRIDHDWTAIDTPSVTRNRFAVALRARQIDEWAAEFLRRTPDATVLHLACGLDSRVLRLAPPAGVRWFDVDLPDVVALRRELYRESGGHRTIAASVTDEAWLTEIPADRPVLILAEGLLMYLREAEVRRLLARLTTRFGTGELIFDGVAPWIARTTRVLTRLPDRWYDHPAYWTAVRDGTDVERWNPRLRHRESVAVVAQHERVPDPSVRRLYRLGDRFAPVRNHLRVFRAEF